MQTDIAKRILVVEDDPELSQSLEMVLESRGYHVTLATDGDVGIQCALELPGYSLLILDAKLPGRSGFDILREALSAGVRTPVLMLTGLGAHEDKMRGFELGADDYITKPFSTEELLARIEAILERSVSFQEFVKGVYTVGGVRVDLERKRVTRDGARIEMTDLEYQLLQYLIIHQGRTVSREQILRDVWKLPGDIETRTIDRHINAVRRGMDGEDEETWAIKSVYGIGYKLIDATREQE